MDTYEPDANYPVSVAYFSMEYAIDQALKIYSGGLGFLAGSHLRSACDLGQNITAVGILWSYGYYDQQREHDGSMKPGFVYKHYSFLEETGIQFTITIHHSPVQVKVLLLKPGTFGTVPLYLMSTDVPENDYLARTISHRLYDPNEATRIAQSILLGAGGAKLLEVLKIAPDVYHLNEGHALPLAFHLYKRYKNLPDVQKRMVFTIHTPERAGNEQHDFNLLDEMSFFSGVPIKEVRSFLNNNNAILNYTETALKMSRKANAVSKINGDVTRHIWSGTEGICEIISITNAQNKKYWADHDLETALTANDDQAIISRKKTLKKQLFAVVADQCGKLFNVDTLTIVWARRFAGYKRADLLLYDWNRFLQIINSVNFPVQVIWAGKPYPEDQEGITLFNRIWSLTEMLPNCAVLTGYELELSALLKRGSDIWLNTPRMYHEASGTSGMSAAMNCSINVSIPDGWIPEFALDTKNCFIIKPAGSINYTEQNDHEEARNMLDLLEHTVIPKYYESASEWLKIIKKAWLDIRVDFDSERMVNQYTYLLYQNSKQD